MSTNYTLEVISHHPQFDNKSLRKYHVEGIDTVGAWGNEPFEIRFKNHTWQKIQVKISVDGTDVFTGQPADTNASDKMWVVNGYDTLSLKAWPENNNGGAGFVFTSANNGVAIHTHGNMSSRGIIAAAVFVEGHKPEPIRIVDHHHHYPYTYPYIYTSPFTLTGDCILNGPTWMSYNSNTLGDAGTFSVQTNSSVGSTLDSIGKNCASMDSLYEAAPAGDRRRDAVQEHNKSLQSLAAVGAGQHVNQQISYVEGLVKPIFTETVRVKYVWWDDLVAALQKNNVAVPHASGFPGDNQRNINLKGTPRLPVHGSFRRSEPLSYQRV